jgi:hypothetical protein
MFFIISTSLLFHGQSKKLIEFATEKENVVEKLASGEQFL